MGKPTKYNSRQLTNHLRELAAEAHDWADGETITRGEALARLLFKRALGGTETFVDDEGKQETVVYKPEVWAIQLIYDRLEGKTAPTAAPEDTTRTKALDRVRQLSKDRANAMAGAPARPGPPRITPRDKPDAK